MTEETTIPPRLYKYLGPERHHFLHEPLMRAAPATSLDDIFEMRPAVASVIPPNMVEPALASVLSQSWDNLIDSTYDSWPAEVKAFWSRDAIKALLRDFPPDRDEIGAMLRNQVAALLGGVNRQVVELRATLERTVASGVGALCFSAACDTPMMWSKYADSYQGFVVGFDTSHRFFDRRRGPEDEFYRLREVRYVQDRPRVECMADLTGVELFDTKSHDWAYQKEWRMLVPLKDVPPTATAAGVLNLVPIPPDCIVEVIYGPRLPIEARQDLENALADARFAQVQQCIARPDDLTYAIRVLPI